MTSGTLEELLEVLPERLVHEGVDEGVGHVVHKVHVEHVQLKHKNTQVDRMALE